MECSVMGITELRESQLFSVRISFQSSLNGVLKEFFCLTVG